MIASSWLIQGCDIDSQSKGILNGKCQLSLPKWKNWLIIQFLNCLFSGSHKNI